VKELLFSERARKDWSRLDSSIQRQIRRKLAYFFQSENPLQHAEKLQDASLGEYRFRIGDYRIIFDARGNDFVVLRVGHRRDIYKK